METLTITRPQLLAVLLKWEEDARAGKTSTPEDAALLTAEEAAEINAINVWSELRRVVAAQPDA